MSPRCAPGWPRLHIMKCQATDVGINSLERVGSGNSSENWFFQACWRRGGREERHELVLRRTPNSEIVRNSRIDEFLLLKALDDTGLPVPRVFWIDRDGRWLGRPAVVLARCPGRDDRSLLLPQGKAGLHESQRVAIAAEMRSEEHTSELQSLMRISYAVFCLNKK